MNDKAYCTQFDTINFDATRLFFIAKLAWWMQLKMPWEKSMYS